MKAKEIVKIILKDFGDRSCDLFGLRRAEKCRAKSR